MKTIKWIFVAFFALQANHIAAQDFDLAASMQRGSTVYSSYCASCHMFNGAGIPGVYTSLVNDYEMMNDVPRLVKSVLVGLNDSANGDTGGVSHVFSLSDRETADLLNYIRNSWGNEGEAVLPEDIQAALSDEDESE